MRGAGDALRPSNIISHRGAWLEAAEKNSIGAFREALNQGFGIETDFRDLDGSLVVSHDPARTGRSITAEDFFALCCERRASGQLLALNIKADGLQALLQNAIARSGIDPERCFVFDMSIPDTLGYFDLPLPVFARQSEYEPEPAFLDRIAGVWIDSFTGDFPQIDEARRWLDKDYKVAFVSPELHRRPHETVWAEIRDRGLHRRQGFSICTDFPSDAATFFSEA